MYHSIKSHSSRTHMLLWLFGLPLLLAATDARADDTQTTQAPSSEQVEHDQDGRINIMEENDYFVSNDDKHYTQGGRISYLSGPITPGGGWDAPYRFLGTILPIYEDGPHKRKYEWTVIGQSIFTPTNTATATPSPRDRPYAAWLYTGASLLQEDVHETHNTLENFELMVGVVGPPALGDMTQNDYHQFINVTPALGWQKQLNTEPGAIATYERKWRFQQHLLGNFAVDAIPEAGVSLGNILTYGETSILFRVGQNLGADYGPDRIRPSLSGTGWFDTDQLDGDFGWYVYAGTQGRMMGYNIFLDGNTYTPSQSVDKRLFVADFTGGATVFWSSAVSLNLTFTQRTQEFYGQTGSPDRFGGLNVAFRFY